MKTRALAARLAQSGYVRVNGVRVASAGRALRVGDVLTIAFEHTTRVVEVLALGERRGPATEAETLLRDVSHS